MWAYHKFTMGNLQSSLKRSQLIDRFTDEDIQDYARKAYHQKDLVLVPLSEITDDYVKQAIINFADRKYGKR